MPKKTSDLYTELEQTLRKFSPEHLREHVVQELPMEWLCVQHVLEIFRENLSTRAAAAAVVALARSSKLAGHMLEEAVANLRLKATGLSNSKMWRVYELEGERDFLDDPDVARQIGSFLKTPVRVARGSAGSQIVGVGTKSHVALVFQEYNVLMTNWTGPMLLDGITFGLGYSNWKSAHLSGRRPSSLLSMVHMHRAKYLLPKPAPPGPVRTSLGLAFNLAPVSKLNDLPPVLPAVELRAPRATLTLRSNHVIKSLHEMVEKRIISVDNPLYQLVFAKGRTDASLQKLE